MENQAPPKHIFHLLFTKHIGGLECAYLDYTRALMMRGFKVTAVVLPDAPYISELKKLGCHVITIKVKGFYDVLAWWKLRGLLKAYSPQLILAHNGRAVSAAASAALGLGIPVVGVSHSYNMKHVIRADLLLLLTNSMRNNFISRGYPANRCVVMTNMIDLTDIKKANNNHPIHTPPSIGLMCRLVPEKGANHLIRALATLKNKGIVVNLQIAGTGAEENKLINLTKELRIEKQVKFCGWLAGAAKEIFFSEIDILCVPSTEEPFGLVVIEGWKYGVPVIASDADGPASIITDGKNGIIFPKGNVASLANAIENMIGDSNKVQQIVENAQQDLLDYGIESGAKRLESIILDAIHNKTR